MKIDDNDGNVIFFSENNKNKLGRLRGFILQICACGFEFKRSAYTRAYTIATTILVL